MNKTFIVVPSYINSYKRLLWAKHSFASLINNMSGDYPVVVIDDLPGFKNSFLNFFSRPFHSVAGKVYNHENVIIHHQNGNSSNAALQKGVKLASEKNAELIFIHLDDNVYTPVLGDLLKWASHAFEQDEELMEIRLAGMPILCTYCNKEEGNRSMLKIENDTVKFENSVFNPKHYDDFTLWWTYYNPEIVEGRFCPIVMWSTIYRAKFLKQLLTFKKVVNQKTLGEVEIFYKNKNNWNELLNSGFIRGKMGYINMQFCGIEMQRNKNWKKLIKYPNTPVR